MGLRIVSTVPSITELLYDLNLDQEVVGITKFCVHPNDWFKTKPRIGGTKNLNIEKILALKPDLIIANKEENVKEQIELLSTTSSVYVSDVKTLEDNVSLIKTIGQLTNRVKLSQKLIQEFEQCIRNLDPIHQKTAVYLIWQDPYMLVGGDTYINSMMELCGLKNLLVREKRYPVIEMEHIEQMNPELILLSSEPFPFNKDHVQKLQPKFPNSKIILTDGEIFSWYGTRLIHKFETLQSFLNEIKKK